MPPEQSANTTTLTLNPSPHSTSTPTPSPDPDRDNADKLSKPRPITSCAACRMRKVKCNRGSPCSACIARKTVAECTYATTTEEREAIAQADQIAELRATRNKLQSQLAKSVPGSGFPQVHGPAPSTSSQKEEEVALEAVYAVLRGGSLDLVREVVGRIRSGEGVIDVLGGLEGVVDVGVGVEAD
ncbi:hypothetical protein BDW62DRAFT_198694 [Aspergillus aurantiobrunneus]